MKKARGGLGQVTAWLSSPVVLAITPVILVACYYLAGEQLFLALPVLLVPAALSVANLLSRDSLQWSAAFKDIDGLALRASAEKMLTKAIFEEDTTGESTAALVIELDSMDRLKEQFGERATSRLMKLVSERLICTVRDNDLVVRLDQKRFAIALSPVRRFGLESVIHLAHRLQSAVDQPFAIDGKRVFVTCCIGFCLAGRLADKNGESMISAAQTALFSAQETGPGTVRGYSPDQRRRRQIRSKLRMKVAAALEANDIRAWFRPAMNARTTKITSLEAVARWEVADAEVLLPQDFLAALREQGLEARFGERMITHALGMLRDCDKAGLDVPLMTLPYLSALMSDPTLPDRIKWDLDRFDIAPERLAVSLSEDVLTGDADTIFHRNISSLSAMGCRIEIGQFGTGNSSLDHLRRLPVNRIKIDRQLIARIDRDPHQQAVVEAVLTMASKLDLDTVADGVETSAELAAMSKLGCGYVQGFAVSSPMPPERIIHWLSQQVQSPQTAPV